MLCLEINALCPQHQILTLNYRKKNGKRPPAPSVLSSASETLLLRNFKRISGFETKGSLIFSNLSEEAVNNGYAY